MDKQNQIGLDSLNNSGSGLTEVPWSAPQGAQLTEVPLLQTEPPAQTVQPAAPAPAPAQPAPTAAQPVAPAAKPAAPAAPKKERTTNPFFGDAISDERLNAIAKQEGLNEAQTRIWKEGILAQESGKGADKRTSVDGAMGAGQVIPSTFKLFAKPGESIDNEDHNLNVSARYVKYLANKFGDDAGKVAVGYFSGEGNVNRGEGEPYKADKKDGNGKYTSSYVADIVNRLTGIKEAKAQPAEQVKTPAWTDITAKPDYGLLSPEDKRAAKEAYFDYYIAPTMDGDEADLLRQEFLNMADPTRAGATSAPVPKSDVTAQQTKPAEKPGIFANAGLSIVEGLGRMAGNALDAETGNIAPEQPKVNSRGSVMNTAKPLKGTPSSSFAPVRPEIRKALENAWDAAPPKERKRLEALSGWQGDIFRARSQGFQRQDKVARDPLKSVQTRQLLEAAYDAAPPDERKRLEALPGWQGDIFRQKRDGMFSIGKNKAPDAPVSLPSVQRFDPRVEERKAELIRKGEDARFAEKAAEAGALAGVDPGKETTALPTFEKSNFDFETQKLFDPNERPNGLNNPLVRGLVKGGSDVYKFSVGINEFVWDAVGADELAKEIGKQGDWLRVKEEALGDGGNLKNLEGAIRSLSAQLPLIASGSQGLALGGMGAMVFGQEYSDGRAKGQTFGEATARAGLYAIAEVIGEKLSIGANIKAARSLFDGAPVGDLPKLLASIVAREVPGEALTTTLQFGTDKIPGGVGLNTEAGLAEFIQQQADTFVQTLIQSGLMGGAPIARSHLTNKGAPTERRVAEIRAQEAQTRALQKWQEFRESLRPADDQGRVAPTMGAPTMPVSNVTTDGRIEPTWGMPGATPDAPLAPTPQAMTPEPEPVTPEPTPEPAPAPVARETPAPAQPAPVTPPPAPAAEQVQEPQPLPPPTNERDQSLMELAEVRQEQLEAKRDGGTTTVMTEEGPQEVETPPAPLNQQEQKELAVVQSGNYDAIEQFYFGNQPKEASNESVQAQPEVGGSAPSVVADGQPSGPAAVEEPAAQAAAPEGRVEGGEQQQGLPVEGQVDPDEEARLEREAIQAEGETPVEEPDDSDIPFDTTPRNGNQTPEAEQAEAQRPEEPAPAAVEQQKQLDSLDALIEDAKQRLAAEKDPIEKIGLQGRIDALEQYKQQQTVQAAPPEAAPEPAPQSEPEPQAEEPEPPKTEKEARERRFTLQKIEAGETGTGKPLWNVLRDGEVVEAFSTKADADAWVKEARQAVTQPASSPQAEKPAATVEEPEPPKTEKEAQERKQAAAEEKQPSDLDSLFDELLQEEKARMEAAPAPAEPPKTEKEAKARREEEQGPEIPGDYIRNINGVWSEPTEAIQSYIDAGYVKTKTFSDGAIQLFKAGESTNGVEFSPNLADTVRSMLPAPKTEKEAKEQRTAAEAAKSAAKNTVEGFTNAIDGLGKLFGGDSGTLGSGPVFNEDTYEKAKPLFEAAAANFSEAGADIKDVMRAVIRTVMEKFGSTVAENMKPYIVRFSEDFQKVGTEEAKQPEAAPSDLFTPEGKATVAQSLADELIGGAEFNTIIEARKKISEMIGRPIEAATELAKQADETVEVAVVQAAREIVEAGRKQGRSPQVIYDRLVDLYKRQPNLSVRSSTSVREQAYSTPVPLAYLASELAGITYQTKVLEPTAGNGMLLIGAATTNSIANELNPKRAAMLTAIGFNAKTDNAATGTLAPAKSQDVVIANPPFGATKDDEGNTIVYEIKPNYGTREVDHAIAFRALATMKDDGQAVLIVGGVQAEGDEPRREEYRAKSKRTFYFNLYNDYKVTDHFTVDGSLYSKQGATYPVDVIVIAGRGKSDRELPAANLPIIIGSYDELKEKLNGTGSVESPGVSGAAGTNSGDAAGGEGDGERLVGGTGRSGDGNGAGSGAGGNTAVVQGTGDAGNAGSGAGGAVSGDEQPESAYQPKLRSDGRESVSDDGKKRPGSERSDRGNRSGNVDGTRTVDGERVESGLTDRRGKEQETENQVSYAPLSKAASVGTLVPRAMRDSIQQSLNKVQGQRGNIDEFVAKSLNYTPKQLRDNFSAEQIDALALAIQNAQQNRGFIIGDQTGIGKGRVVAAMIRYAMQNGKIPIFVTEKPNLYSDMIRDLDDIGMTEELGLDTKTPKILMTNADETVPYSLIREKDGEITETNMTLRPPKTGKAMGDLLRQMMADNSLGDKKVIFTTYSQLQTVKGKVTDRMKFVKQFGAGNYMIFDESHNAGGGGETQARTADQRQKVKEGEAPATGRAAFVRGLVKDAGGTFFSSATYAKRPDVMDLYSSTNMKLAVDKISQLGEAIKNGGVPMQQVVATMLTQDGQYIRRERTFAGVSYDTQPTKVDLTTAENMAAAMRSILDFSRAKEAVVKSIQKEMDKEGALIKQMGGESSTIQGANFGSIMHNLIDQMLLSLKAQESVNHAIARLKAGEKVVMTVSNTMGSFLRDYAKDMGLNMGDPVALSFKDLYDRYLEKQRIVTIKDGAGNKTQRRLTDAELGPSLVKKFEAVRKQIASSGFGAAPISPIDHLHNELRKAGYKTDEITGRTVTLNYQSGTPKLTSRTADIRQRVKAVRGFNNGEIDVIILNQAGSTGLSLHASSKFKDQRKRHMIIVQAEKNIDTHMQMLGRVHRTGQIVPPAYSQMMADIPAETRPAAVLMKKMASLNANTTASRKSSVTAEGVVDFMNDYGGQVAQEFLRDNPDVLEAIGGTNVIQLMENSEEATEDDIRKFTGYIPILPIKQQEQIYKDLVDRYNELIERENTLGTNKLEAKAVDLDAQTLSSEQITENKGDPSIFASPATMEQVDVKRNVKPYTSAEVKQTVNERLGDKTGGAIANELTKDVADRTAEFEKQRVADLLSKEADPVRIEAQRSQISMMLNHVRTILQNYRIGDTISIKDKNGFIVYGVITDIENRGRTQNPAAGSAWRMQIALANGDAKSLTINFGQIGSRYELAREARVNWYNAETQSAQMMDIMEIFDKGSTARREKRWLVTGNILAGFAKYPGQIIQYTKKDGSTGQGVLMTRQFDYAKEKKDAPVTLKSGDQVMQFFREAGERAMVGTPDGVLKINFYGGRFNFAVPSSKREGGTYYLDKGITDPLNTDFYKRGQQMQANTFSAEDAKAALDYIINEREDTIIALSNLDTARKLFAPKPAQEQGGVETFDIPVDIATDSAFSSLPDPERVSALQRLKSLERRAEAGKITDAEYRLGIAQLIAQLQKRAEERAAPLGDRVRGPDWVKERLLRARRLNELPAEAADFALWLLDKNPALARDLAISIRERGPAAGSYQSIDRLMSLFKQNINSGTAVHEILHHAERMMPNEMQQGITREWQRAWDAAFRKGDEKVRAALLQLMKGGFGNKEAFAKAVGAFRDGTLKYDEHYQLTSPSEYWAVNATRIMANRYGANTWQEKARNFLRDLIEYMKGALGYRSDAPIIKALRQVMNGDGQYLSGRMLVEQYLADTESKAKTADIPNEFMDIRDSLQGKLFKDKAKLTTFNWYDKSISTQLNKAFKDADYAKVFGYVNAIQNEISLTSLRPAELAPGYLPRITDVKAAAKTLVIGRKAGAQQAKASQAIFAGTLAGENVMEGKVWTEEELRNNFGLDDTGVALYNQARAAIDASLNEVAAAESYAMAQGFIPKAMRRAIIDNPASAESLISASLEQQIKKLQRAAKVARDAGNEQQAASMDETLNAYFSTAKQVEKIFTTARNLKASGYAPLMRFGKYTVTVQMTDPQTGNILRDEDGNAVPAIYFGKFETEGEALAVMQTQQMKYAGQDDVKISAGTASQQGYEMYSGISPETIALFAEALGATKVMRKYIEEALSERSALKRRLERAGVEGYTQDMPRVLANFITSNARHAAKQYYMRDLNNAIKYIPKEKGDVRDEAINLREFALNSKDPGSVASSIAFFWFLGGSVSSAVVNLTQPLMMTAPYLSQYGTVAATAAMAKAMPIALGKKQITDGDLRAALRRASQEGVVDAQEIFHLYSQGAQSASTWLASALSKVPGAGAKIKAGSESARARMSAFGVLWGSMFAAAESFNRRLTFVAAWEVAKATGVKNPYAFAVRAVNETQGIFNKANRPNWARKGIGRMAFTFKQYSIAYLELVKRMVKNGGPEGRRAALMMLAVLMLASGEEGLPFAQDLNDLIDTIGQFMGYDTNTLRKKRELAYDLLGKEFGDLFLYGVSSFLPLDFQGRLGLGNLIPGTSLLKKSENASGKVRAALEIVGPTASIGTQLGDAAEAASDENYAQAGRNLAPTAVRNFLLGLDMLDKGYASDAAGNKKVDTTPADAYIKMVGFNPTVVAEKNRSQMVLRQDVELQSKTESSIVKQWARGLVENDQEMIDKAQRRMDEWNEANPKTPIYLTRKQIKEAVRNLTVDSDTRLIKKTPREMRGRAVDELLGNQTDE